MGPVVSGETQSSSLNYFSKSVAGSRSRLLRNACFVLAWSDDVAGFRLRISISPAACILRSRCGLSAMCERPLGLARQ